MQQIGDINKRIEIQSPTTASDGMSAAGTVTFSTLATVWAGIWPISASEQVQAMKDTMTITHRIRMRYRSGMLPSYRLKFGTRYFNIVSIVNPSERNEWLDLICKEAS